MIILIVAGVLFAVIFFVDYKKEEINFLALLGFSLMLSAVITLLIDNDSSKTSKKRIEPKIKIECKNNKCDTTYIYE